MRRVSYYLPERDHASLKRLSKLTDISMSEHIRRAINQYLLEMGRTEEILNPIGKQLDEAQGD